MTMAMVTDVVSGKTSTGSCSRFSFSRQTSDNFSTGFDADSSIDFNFCINHEDHRSSSADELFRNGKLLPFDLIRHPPPLLPPPKAVHHRLPPTVSAISDHPSSNTQNLTNNWRFKRSFSLTFFSADNYQAPGSFQSTVRRLFRSKSTGSAPKVKEPPLLKDRDQNPKQPSQKRSAASRSAESVPLMGYQKPPLKKRYMGSYSPVINVPSFDLFGFSSVFVRGREKKTSKRTEKVTERQSERM